MAITKTHEFKRPDDAEAYDLMRRASVAWLQAGGQGFPDARSGFKLHKGLGYVVLHAASGILAVYRVRSDNRALRRMARWPKGLEK